MPGPGTNSARVNGHALLTASYSDTLRVDCASLMHCARSAKAAGRDGSRWAWGLAGYMGMKAYGYERGQGPGQVLVQFVSVQIKQCV